MRKNGFSLRLVIALFVGVTGSSTARASDLENMVVNLVRPLSAGSITSAWDCVYQGLCATETTSFDALLGGTGSTLAGLGLQLDSLSSVTSGVVNDRIVPLSSSVSGFTYDYNPDLDVYDRSTKTFGPLFSERAQTIGKKRFMVGLSQSYLEFDEFNGDNLSSTTLQELGGNLATTDASSDFAGITLVSLTGNQQYDVDLDLNIKEWVSTAYFTYGLTERIDVGLVVPFMRLKAEAKASLRDVGAGDTGALKQCSDPSLADDVLSNPFAQCIGASANLTSTNSDSETYFGIGDLVVRGKWNFLVGIANAALTAEATIPTGDPSNLTGLHTMTYRPGLVVSKDLETPVGGLGLQGYAGYNFRPDEPDQQEFDWAVGAALQPLGRASISLDLLGNRETRGTENSILDGSVGLKLMLAQNVLIDFNWIAPLNNDGLRPSAGIFTFQIEGVFGD